ncbi:GNAT family N-acetyltransferase [Kurthia sibirica]|nr:GNAT family N-acetyltransferase [Kurthia sibirica]GEK34171.1 GNAT family N-acetyltransferase [Kurthia sibirica]
MQIRTLAYHEIPLIGAINCQETSMQSYNMSGILTDTPYKVNAWEPQKLADFILKIEDIYFHGGVVLGAYQEARLVGIAVLDLQYISGFRLHLEALYIDQLYRRQGIGNIMVQKILQIAYEKEAEALYIRSPPSQNTVDFFSHRGARLAERVDSYLQALAPETIQLEIPIIR